MTETHASLTRKRLTTPRAAAIAWLETNGRTISLALNLVPFAGIAFLWFIGVIRDRLEDLEDRLFATVFLGSGLLFMALTFVGAALAGGLLSSYIVASSALVESGVYTYSRAVMNQIINVYAMRMAGVFMISLGTIWLRTGLMHRGWALLTYALALVLLLSISYSLWVTMIFPIWVLAVSVYILILNLRHPSQESLGEI